MLSRYDIAVANHDGQSDLSSEIISGVLDGVEVTVIFCGPRMMDTESVDGGAVVSSLLGPSLDLPAGSLGGRRLSWLELVASAPAGLKESVRIS